MGKPTGFLEYNRVDAGHRSVKDRIGDYNEFTLPQDIECLKTQGARCMDCGVPFCHGGFVVEGLSIGCPLSGLIPEMNDLVYHGKIEEAYSRISLTHPFPEITGRICPALCEGSCTLGEHEPAVAIKDIERYVGDFMLDKILPCKPENRTNKRVAVIGSGPAGLACAELLNKLGNHVTVFEKADRAGGFLMYGIPNMKLDKKIIEKRICLMELEGVKFMLSTDVGGDYPVLKLMKEFDATVLCAGARKERELSVKGRELPGVVTAISYLTGVTRSILDGKEASVSAKGKHVVVVGGGDTGTDCVATAVRQGALSVRQLEIMPELPSVRAKDNPWPLWPKIKRTEYGQTEYAQLMGQDPREYLITVKEIKGEKQVSHIETVQVEWIEKDGRLLPEEIEGTEVQSPAELIISAMGFEGPEQQLIRQLDLDTDKRGNVKTDEGSYKSSLASVFAAGDVRRGPSLAVWAINEGRKAAMECHRYLMER